MRNAYALFEELDHAWRVFHREVYQDKFNDRHLIKVRIEKFNGQEVILEGDPDSILSLCSNLMQMLNQVGTGVDFNTSHVMEFQEHLTSLLALLHGGEGTEA